MDFIGKKLKLSKNDYYVQHVKIINSILPANLTKREIELIASFLMLRGDITEDLFGTQARKIVKRKTGLSDASLSRYLGILADEKGFLTRTTDNGGFEMIPALKSPNPHRQVYKFLLVCEDEEE